jgi:hypothetical protein
MGNEWSGMKIERDAIDEVGNGMEDEMMNNT